MTKAEYLKQIDEVSEKRKQRVKQKTSQREILVAQANAGGLGGTGGNTFERVILECAAGRTGGHHALFGTGDLVFAESLSQGAVSAVGLD